MKRINLFYFTILVIVTAFTSCKENEPDTNENQNPYEIGAFVTNEGAWGTSNASISFFDFQKKEVENDVFYTVNERVLGDLLQSATLYNDKIYMILNGSNKIEVATYSDFEEVATIEDFLSPRYMTIYNGKGYVSQWGNGGQVKVINLTNNIVEATIEVGAGPEQIIAAGGNLFVANCGEYGVDSVLSVIDPATNVVIKNIVVGDNPMEMALDANGDLWVLCYGYVKYALDYSIESETPSKLVKVDVNNQTKLSEIIISNNKHPMNMDISPDKETIYYGGDFSFSGIYAIDITATEVNSIALIDGTKTFYGFNVNPVNGDIYALESTSFTDAGKMYRYTSSGTEIDSYNVGIGPKSVIFAE
ncbi:MAG TPA: hypothetical protein DDX39_10530 [Bacteroidales bacterium]|nr:MAG: hypothetical protein A2W98_00730 [Bacteroidetes bacterium GWF2_33_38]OFY68453.1 MAG: hypothetical protein A2265_04530 [Bacteroidetes bacterium RIFOXYA12_FULL_33_9]HBF89066.1 hypothetical protein [Bacteroidales bacterium]